MNHNEPESPIMSHNEPKSPRMNQNQPKNIITQFTTATATQDGGHEKNGTLKIEKFQRQDAVKNCNFNGVFSTKPFCKTNSTQHKTIIVCTTTKLTDKEKHSLFLSHSKIKFVTKSIFGCESYLFLFFLGFWIFEKLG